MTEEHICYYFTNRSCETSDHERCNEEYTGLNITAKCTCVCHQTRITDFIDKKEKLSDANQTEGRLDISEGVAIVTETQSQR